MAQLLQNSYFPQGPEVTASQQMTRTIDFMKKSPEAAKVFYGTFHSFMSVLTVAKLVAMLLKCLATSVDVERASVAAAEELCGEIDGPEGTKLIDSENARRRLMLARTNAEASLLLEYRATWAGAEKKPNMAYGPMAKMFSSERFLEDARDLLDLTAPVSLTKRDGAAALINQSYRHAHGTRIYGGTSQVQHNIVGEHILGLPK